ncbi:MAG: polysaccharide deacetylase [Clostridia bacterium]|jgi:peptidoglycan/xylan/chitin deacetylase (PgdA/CDA1 family)|nr:polysaccharide deacetylase [Clostridia bacterium]
MKLYVKKGQRKTNPFVFVFLAIVFIGSTSFLAAKTINKMDEFNQTKSELEVLEDEKSHLETSSKDFTIKEEELQKQVIDLEQRLQQIKRENPEVEPVTEDNKKYAYLTFDDGPSKNTPKILDFLKANHIKATFFVIGDASQTATYKRIVEEGHTLAVHTNTHKYSDIYKNVDSFMKDIERLDQLLEESTGIKPNVMRFPGGSNNTIAKRYAGFDIMEQIIPKMKQQGFVYFDWNVDSGDASKSTQDKQVIVDSVLNGAKSKEQAIILMHDAAAKTTTVEALPEIVEGLRKQGFVFEKLTAETETIHFR